jgi:hypothetical protein
MNTYIFFQIQSKYKQILQIIYLIYCRGNKEEMKNLMQCEISFVDLVFQVFVSGILYYPF